MAITVLVSYIIVELAHINCNIQTTLHYTVDVDISLVNELLKAW